MYHFHYDYVIKTFDNVKLLFTDTDSLVYEIKNGNVYNQCFKDNYLISVDMIKIVFIMMIVIRKNWAK